MGELCVDEWQSCKLDPSSWCQPSPVLRVRGIFTRTVLERKRRTRGMNNEVVKANCYVKLSNTMIWVSCARMNGGLPCQSLLGKYMIEPSVRLWKSCKSTTATIERAASFAVQNHMVKKNK